jgi:hypothetical protein
VNAQDSVRKDDARNFPSIAPLMMSVTPSNPERLSAIPTITVPAPRTDAVLGIPIAITDYDRINRATCACPTSMP